MAESGTELISYQEVFMEVCIALEFRDLLDECLAACSCLMTQVTIS